MDADALIAAVAGICRVSKAEFCGRGKSPSVVVAKKVFVLIGREAGASSKHLSEITGMSLSAVSRRHDGPSQDGQGRENEQAGRKRPPMLPVIEMGIG